MKRNLKKKISAFLSAILSFAMVFTSLPVMSFADPIGFNVKLNLYEDYDMTTPYTPTEPMKSKTDGPFYVVAVAKGGKDTNNNGQIDENEVWTTYSVQKLDQITASSTDIQFEASSFRIDVYNGDTFDHNDYNQFMWYNRGHYDPNNTYVMKSLTLYRVKDEINPWEVKTDGISYKDMIAQFDRDDSAPESFSFRSSQVTDASNGVINLYKSEYDAKYEFRVNLDGCTLNLQENNLFALVEIKHKTTEPTYFIANISSNGRQNLVYDATDQFLNQTGNIAQSQKFTGNEVERNVYILRLKPSETQVPSNAQIINKGSMLTQLTAGDTVETFKILSVESGFEDNDTTKIRTHYDVLNLEHITTTPYYNYLTILKDNVNHGILANRIELQGHSQTNLVTNMYVGSGNIDSNLSGYVDTNLSEQFGGTAAGTSIATEIEGVLLFGSDTLTTPTVLTSSQPVSEHVQSNRNDINAVYKEKSALEAKVNGLIQQMKDISYALVPQEPTLKPIDAGNNTILIDATAFGPSDTIFIDGDNIKEYIERPDGIKIKKLPDQVIVFNFDDTDTLNNIGEILVDSGDGYHTTDTVWADADNIQNYYADEIARHIVYNLNSVTSVEKMERAGGIFLLPQDNAIAAVGGTSCGWFLNAGTTKLGSSGEFHFVYHDLGQEPKQVLTLKKLVDGATPGESFDFSVEKRVSINPDVYEPLKVLNADNELVDYVVSSNGSTISIPINELKEGLNVIRIKEINDPSKPYKENTQVFYASFYVEIYMDGETEVRLPGVVSYADYRNGSRYNPVESGIPTFNNETNTDEAVVNIYKTFTGDISKDEFEREFKFVVTKDGTETVYSVKQGEFRYDSANDRYVYSFAAEPGDYSFEDRTEVQYRTDDTTIKINNEEASAVTIVAGTTTNVEVTDEFTAETSNFELFKHFSNNTPDEYKAEDYEFALYQDGTKIDTITLNTANEFHKVIDELPVYNYETGALYKYKVVEIAKTMPSYCKFVIIGDNNTEFTIEEPKDININNMYEEVNCNIELQKFVSLENGDEIDEDKLGEIKFEITNPKGEVSYITYDQFENGSYMLSDVPAGKWTIKEVSKGSNKYYTWISTTIDGTESDNVELSLGPVSENVIFENVYTKTENKIIIAKTVEIDAAPNENFYLDTVFTVKEADTGETVYEGKISDQSWTDTGLGTYFLILDVDPDKEYIVTETPATDDKFSLETEITYHDQKVTGPVTLSAQEVASFKNTYTRNYATINLEKYISVDASLLDDIEFDVVCPFYDEPITITADNFVNGKFVKEIRVPAGYPVTITEIGNGAISPYNLISTTVDGEDGFVKNFDSLSKDDNVTVKFENEYQSTGVLSIAKELSGDVIDGLENGKYIEFTITSPSLGTKTVQITKEQIVAQRDITISDTEKVMFGASGFVYQAILPFDTYTVSETANGAYDNVTVTTTLDGESTASLTKTLNSEMVTFNIKNTYTVPVVPPTICSLFVTKEVVNEDNTEIPETFEFCVKKGSVYLQSKDSADFAETEKYFTISAGETIEFTNLDCNVVYTVEEKALTSDKFTCEADVTTSYKQDSDDIYVKIKNTFTKTEPVVETSTLYVLKTVSNEDGLDVPDTFKIALKLGEKYIADLDGNLSDDKIYLDIKADETLTINNLPQGTVIIEEEEIENCTLCGDTSITLAVGENVALITNIFDAPAGPVEEDTYNLTVTKDYENITNAKAPVCKFYVESDEKGFIKSLDPIEYTDVQGEAYIFTITPGSNKVLNLPKDKYTLTEITSDLEVEGFEYDQDASTTFFNVELESDMTDGFVNVYKSKIKISKVKAFGYNSIAGAELELYKDGELITSWISSATEVYEFPLVDGVYVIKEKQAPEGYEKTELDVSFTVVNGVVTEVNGIDGNLTEEGLIEFKNDPIKVVSGLNIKVIEEDTKEPVPDAIIEVTGPFGENGEEITKEFTTDENGQISPDSLPVNPGKYKYKIKSVPAGYKVTVNEENEIEVPEGKTVEDVIEIIPSSSIIVNIIDEDTTEPIPGIKIIVSTPDGDKEIATDEEGKAKIEDVTPGDYKIKKIILPSGFEIPKDIPAPIGRKETVIKDLVVDTDVSNLIIDVVDEVSSNPVPHALVKVKYPDGTEKTFETDENGKIEKSLVPSGNYEITVTQIPEGFVVSVGEKQTVTVPKNETTEAHAKINKNAGSLLIKVIDKNSSNPVPHAKVKVVLPNGSEMILESDDNGEIKQFTGKDDSGYYKALPGIYKITPVEIPSGYEVDMKTVEQTVEVLKETSYIIPVSKKENKPSNPDNNDDNKPAQQQQVTTPQQPTVTPVSTMQQPGNYKAPQTGENHNFMYFYIFSMISLFGAAISYIFIKKKQYKDN